MSELRSDGQAGGLSHWNPGSSGEDCLFRSLDTATFSGIALLGFPLRLSVRFCVSPVKGFPPASLTFQQRQDGLGSGVSLCHGSHSSLIQDLGFGEVGRIRGHVGVADARFGR